MKIFSVRSLYLLAGITCVVIWQTEWVYAWYFIYPLSLLATWSHEMGHGVTAILLGGKFSHLFIYPNGNGIAYFYVSSDLLKAITAAGGLLGPSLLGFLMARAITSEWSARRVLRFLAFLLVLSVILFVRNLSGVIIVLILAKLVYILSYFFGKWKIFCAQLLSAQLILSPLRNWRYLFIDEAYMNGKLVQSDVSHIADYFLMPVPFFLWGALFVLISLTFFIFSFKRI